MSLLQELMSRMDDDDYRQMVKELKDPEVIAETLKWVERDWPEASAGVVEGDG